MDAAFIDPPPSPDFDGMFFLIMILNLFFLSNFSVSITFNNVLIVFLELIPSANLPMNFIS